MTDPYEPPGGGQPPQYGQFGQPPYGYPVTPKSNDAVIALVAAIASWVICPVVPSIVALVYAGRARQAILASGGALAGQGMVTAARVLAWLHLVVAAVFLVVLVVLILVYAR
jgi:hypothetical protein